MTKFVPFALAVLCTTTVLAGTAAIAQPAPPQAAFTRAQAQAHAAEMFATLDRNDDGQLSPADREAEARARFDAADSDHNGQLSFAEVTAAHEDRREDRAERRDGPGPIAMGGHGRMGGERLAQADTNNDGKVSQAEFTAAALARFDRADANNDGTISADERAAMHGDGDREGGRHERHGRMRG